MTEGPGEGWMVGLRRQLAVRERPLRFLLVGGFNTLFGLSAYPLIYAATRPIQTHYLAVLLITQALCLVVSFLTSKHLVFMTRGGYAQEFGRFLTFHLAHLAVNLAALPLMVEVFGLNPAWAQSAYALLVVVSSYLWHSKITFKVQTPRDIR